MGVLRWSQAPDLNRHEQRSYHAMAILEQVTVPTQTAQSNARRPFGGLSFDRPRAKVWANIGYVVNGNFVPLPLGSPIDTMEPSSVTGTNPEAVKRNTAKNELLSALQVIGDSMQPGEEKELSNLVVRLRRVNEELSIVRADNEFSVGDLMGMLTTGKAAQVTPQVQAEAESGPTKAEIQAQIRTLQRALKTVA